MFTNFVRSPKNDFFIILKWYQDKNVRSIVYLTDYGELLFFPLSWANIFPMGAFTQLFFVSFVVMCNFVFTELSEKMFVFPFKVS